MASYKSSIGHVAPKVESANGTVNAPAETDATVLVYDLTVEPDIQYTPRNPSHSKLSKLGGFVGKQAGRISFGFELKGGGAAGTAPDWGVFARACNLSETIDPNTSVTYAPTTTTSPTTLTMDVFQDGRRWRFIGVAGSMKIECRQGAPLMARSSFMGVLDPTTPLDNTAFSGSPTYQSVVAPVFMGASVSLYSATTYRVTSVDVDFGQDVQAHDSVNAAHGIEFFEVANFNETGAIDPEYVPQATYGDSLLGKLTEGSSGGLTWSVGSGAGNVMAYSCPQIRLTSLQPGDRNGFGIDALGFELVSSAENTQDGFSLAIT